MSCAARQKDIHENVTFKMKVKMIRAAQSLMIATARKMSSAARKTRIEVDAKSKTTQPSQSPTVFNVTETITARGMTSIQECASKFSTTQPSQSSTVFNVTGTITARGQTGIQECANAPPHHCMQSTTTSREPQTKEQSPPPARGVVSHQHNS